MGDVPRETFVPESLQEFAYEDSALPIEAGQTISQPYIVAHMLELAEIKHGDKVLEVGAGSGYAAAVMSRMTNEVFAIERHEGLAKLARARLQRLGLCQRRDHLRRWHQGIAGGGALSSHHCICRRSPCSRSAEAAAGDWWPSDHPHRALRFSDADTRAPEGRRPLHGRKISAPWPSCP